MEFFSGWKVDFVSGWKAASIAVTGAFGILGLLKDFRNKKTRRITTSGYVSLIGILISSILGVAAQLKESADDAAQALLLATNTSTAVYDIQRTLSPIEEPRVTASFRFSCSDPKYKRVCNVMNDGRTHGTPNPPAEWALWPGGQSPVVLQFFVDFIADAGKAQNVLNGKTEEYDLSLNVVSTNAAGDAQTLGIIPADSGSCKLSVLSQKPVIVHNSGNIRSMLDFPGSTLFITSHQALFQDLTLDGLTVKVKSGREISVDGKSCHRSLIDGDVWYRCALPKASRQAPIH